MSTPVLTFFNNKGGVGKTSLVYHLSWMLCELGHRVLVCDLDPQANLTAAFLDEEELAELWESDSDAPTTIHRCLRPLAEVGDLRAPEVRSIGDGPCLVPGDLALSGFEDLLSSEWPRSLDDANLHRAFRVLSSLWQVVQLGARDCGADLALVDVGPNLGAINRSALIASDFVVVPLGTDLFSLQGLRNLGPTLRRWRSEWKKRLGNWTEPAFDLPAGRMHSLGYVVQQHGVRLQRPVKAYDKWVRRIPDLYRECMLDEPGKTTLTPSDDPWCLATLKPYRSLIPLGQEARKPIFRLTVADGAIGSHAQAVRQARADFSELAQRIVERMRESGA